MFAVEPIGSGDLSVAKKTATERIAKLKVDAKRLST
jgi:hypothetical protein